MTSNRALTLLEVLIVLVALVLLVAVLWASLTPDRSSATRVHCMSNLKQVGMSYRVWAGDHGNRFPMQVPARDGGTMEWADGPNAWRHFQVMSNYLFTPVILLCPSEPDPARVEAARVLYRASDRWAGFTNSQFSYSVGIDAGYSNLMFLSGDRNLTNAERMTAGVLVLTTNRRAGWTMNTHVGQGHILSADGSARLYSTPGLSEALAETGAATNRLAIP